MNKQKKFLINIVIIFIVLLKIFNLKVFADVGDFETYDSGYSSSDWSSSSSSWDWDYGSSSSYDYDDYSGSGSGDLEDFIIGLIIFIVIFAVVTFFNMRTNIKVKNPINYQSNIPRLSEDDIVAKIKIQDPEFNRIDFLNWSKDLFVKLQYAWSDRDWSVIRCFETQELFEQHSTQLERYKQEKKINKMERVSVNWARLDSFNQEGDKDILTILLNSKMVDYIIDEETNKVLKGDPNLNKVKTYKLTFIRKTGVKTKLGETTVNTKQCPNCGAPTQITSAGKCEYCGSIITTGEFNWVLSSLEPYNGY